MTDYYVRKDGSNSNDGSADDAAHAWLTLTYAAGQVASGANHTIHVNAGTYAENLTDSRSGVSPGYRYWLASGTVQINGYVSLTGSWIKLEGFTVTRPGNRVWNTGSVEVEGDNNYVKSVTAYNSDYSGFFQHWGADSTTFDTCTALIVGECGVDLRGTNALVVDCDISRVHLAAGDGTDANGIWLHGSGHTIRGNYIHNFIWPSETGATTHVDGIQGYHSAAFPTEISAARNVIIERNHIFMGNDSTGVLIPQVDLGGPTCFMIGGTAAYPADNIVIRNNILEAHTIYHEGNYTGTNNVNNIKLYNNTMVGNITYTSGSPHGIYFDNSSGIEIFNNILVDFYNYHIGVTASTSYTAGYNLFWNSDNTTAAFTNYTVHTGDLRSVSGGTIYDPDFVSNVRNVAANRMLQSSSPAINAGIAGKVTDDYAGSVRGSPPEIGAYEYGTTPSTHTPRNVLKSISALKSFRRVHPKR